MTYHDKLDCVLLALSTAQHSSFENCDQIEKRLNTYTSDIESELLLEYLTVLGYATSIELENEKGIIRKTKRFYRITIQGFLFLEKSSFKSEINKGKRIMIWTTAKTIAATLNAVIIVIIGIYSVILTKQANSDKKENVTLHQKLDSLTSVNRLIKK